nr:hypothetical protein [Tanacetum cinerariifolium]
NDNTKVVNAPQESFVFNQDPGENSSQSPPHIDHRCCYGCGDSLDDIFCQRCTYDSPNPPPQPPTYSYEFCGNDAHYGYDCPPQVPKIPIYYDEDDDEESSTPLRDFIISELPPCITITPVLSTKEPKDSLIMGDDHLDTILEKESDEFIKSSVENLVPSPSESEDISDCECNLPLCDDFPKSHLVTFSNPLFDIDNDFSSSDDKSSSDEDVSKENFKIFSNPLSDEEIISTKIYLYQFNADSDLIESLLNRDTLIISSPKINSLLEEFSSKLDHTDLIPPGINKADCDPGEDIHLVKRLVESLMEEIDLSLTLDDSMPSGNENDDYNSEGDILFLE